MNNRYLQKVVLVLEDNELKEYYIDLEYVRSEGANKCVDIKKVKIHKVYTFSDSRNYIMEIDEEKSRNLGIEHGFYELIRGSFEEIEVNEELEMLLTQAFLSGVVHTKMSEAINSFQMLHKNDIKEWRLPSSSSL